MVRKHFKHCQKKIDKRVLNIRLQKAEQHRGIDLLSPYASGEWRCDFKWSTSRLLAVNITVHGEMKSLFEEKPFEDVLSLKELPKSHSHHPLEQFGPKGQNL